VRIGLISDIHGNRHALEAVVADATRVGVDRWWVLGDLVAIGPDPVGTSELIANLPREVISGNTERYVLTRDRPPPTAREVIANPDLFELCKRPFSGHKPTFRWSKPE
jgi:predicted phosphodiesterase